MAISSNNIQVYTTLSKELVAEIDKDAKENFRTRSQQITFIGNTPVEPFRGSAISCHDSQHCRPVTTGIHRRNKTPALVFP